MQQQFSVDAFLLMRIILHICSERASCNLHKLGMMVGQLLVLSCAPARMGAAWKRRRALCRSILVAARKGRYVVCSPELERSPVL